jgi:hypothetical protein
MFADGHRFFDKLLNFERSAVHPFRDQDQAGNTVGRDSYRVYDLHVRIVTSRSKPEGVHGTSTRSEMALAALSERSLGAVSMTTQPALIRCTCSAGECLIVDNAKYRNANFESALRVSTD